jgi:hypothetical protein
LAAAALSKSKSWSRALAVFWYFVAVVLTLWAVIYLVLRALDDWRSIVVFGVPFILAFLVIFYGEGTELAVASLIDKDPEQFPESLRADFERLRSSPHVFFISGRQLLVVFAIVVLTLLSASLADFSLITQSPPHLMPRLFLATAPLRSAQAEAAFSLLFPTFLALWFMQLPPKFIAYESPLIAYSWQLTRATIAAALFLGRNLRVHGPSADVRALLKRLQPQTAQALKPSRENYYKTSALLRDGIGLELVHIVVEIDQVGAVNVEEQFSYHSYAPGFRYLAPGVAWEAPIDTSTAEYRVVVGSERVPYYNISKPTLTEEVVDGKRMHFAKWSLELPTDLPVNSDLRMQLKYTTKAGAVKSAMGSRDSYSYRVKHIPTASLVVEVRPKVGVSFRLFDPKVKATTSDDKRINDAEANRVTVDAPSGYRYSVKYPLQGTEFEFSWRLERDTSLPASAAGR